MPETVNTAVAILNWNGRELLERFLPGVVNHSLEEAKIYVIDNASTDTSREWLAQNYPQVKVIALPENYGFAKGYNLGIEQITEEYIVLLNSDVEVTKGWLPPLIKRFDENPKLGALQPKIKDLKNPDYFEYAGACGGFMDSLGYPFCRGRLFHHLEKDKGQYDQYRSIFWAGGACIMVRRAAFAESGKLNEMLFAHMEEIDLCWRMQLQGYEVGCEPASQVFHLGGATLNKLSPQKTFLNFRNSLMIMLTNLPSIEGMGKILLRLILDGVAALKFITEGKFAHVGAILRAHFAFYGSFNQLWRRKMQIKPKPFHKLQGVYGGSIVWNFFLREKKCFKDLGRGF